MLLFDMHLLTEKVQSDLHTISMIVAESNDYITLRLNTKFDKRLVSHADPASWNSLPADLHAISDCSCFKSKLKTYLFQLAFDIQ